MYDNSAVLSGGGIVLDFSYNTTISGSVYNNFASNYVGGIYVFNSSNVSILDSYITNNWSVNTNSAIFLDKTATLTNLVISNSVIGSNNNADVIGIYESGQNITKHKLLNNRFITNRLRYLYRESTSDRLITNN